MIICTHKIAFYTVDICGIVQLKMLCMPKALTHLRSSFSPREEMPHTETTLVVHLHLLVPSILTNIVPLSHDYYWQAVPCPWDCTATTVLFGLETLTSLHHFL